MSRMAKDAAIDFVIELETPVRLRETRWVRKLLQIASADLPLIVTWDAVFGLGRPSSPDTKAICLDGVVRANAFLPASGSASPGGRSRRRVSPGENYKGTPRPSLVTLSEKFALTAPAGRVRLRAPGPGRRRCLA